MRLINISTLTALTLEDFIGDEVPPYGILSHTWDKEEVSFQAFNTPEARSFAGYKKIQGFCAIAAKNDLSYVWVDTCCIDKSSSAELSEAINSMYRWYANAECCYVYLSDLETLPVDVSFTVWTVESFDIFKECRWFKRGWTLQELLAPNNVKFYDQQWTRLGTKHNISEVLSRVTGIKLDHLWKCNLASVAQKMSWAAHRVTTRTEDSAYCLLGIFNVNMPLLYGEGKKAFMRLQQEILRSSHDESLFAWTNERLWTSGLLAESPADFAGSSNVVPFDSRLQRRRPYFMTNHGLQIELRRIDVESKNMKRTRFDSPLLCTTESQKNKRQFILHFNRLHDDPEEDRVFRIAPYELGLIDVEEAAKYHSQEVTPFFVQDTTLLKHKPQRLIQRDFPTAASMQLRMSGLVDNIDFSQVHEMPASRLGIFVTDLATSSKFATAYLRWPKQDRNPRSLDVRCREFDHKRNCWKHMDKWRSYELRVGHPCAMLVGTSSVILMAFRGNMTQGLVLDIHVDDASYKRLTRQMDDMHFSWIGEPF